MGPMLLLFCAGLLAGAMNVVAGGGSFVTLPALVAAGVPVIAANASSTVALFPGSLVASWTLRRQLAPFPGMPLWLMAVASVTGGLVGGLLLLATPAVTFDHVLPWLLLFATLAFTFARRAGAALRRYVTLGPAALLGCQAVLGVYGGYYGGAVGLTMLAVWSLFGGADLRTMNANRVMLVAACNAAAVVTFCVSGTVAAVPAIAVGTGAMAGSYGGALLARTARPETLRRAIVTLCTAMTAIFFVRAYG